MADEPEAPEDEPVETDDDGAVAEAEVSALAELALCENLSQTSGWAARWSASMAGADATLLWAPDTVNPLFMCIGASGEGVEKFLRRAAPRESGFVHALVRDRQPLVLTGQELREADPFVRGLPESFRACLAVPLEAEGLIVGLLALFFTELPDADDALARLERFLEQAAPALGRALRSERKTVGMLHAIERLTNLYDLSKAFGSTIDFDELSALIVRKAADFATAEVASLWMLEGDDVTLAATALNENYDIESPPEAVGASLVGDVMADQEPVRRNRLPADDPVATETEGYPVRSVLGVPLSEDDLPVGALVLVNKRGRHPEFSAEDEELLADLARQAVRALRTARQHEAEKKVEELDALLAVSREITATLDLDKVMATVVNATSALIAYDRCGIAIQEKGKLRLGAISGAAEVDRKDPDVRRMEDLLQWVYLSGTDTAVTQTEDGSISADRPETEEKFRAVFQETGLRSFFGVLLKDEEGKLGALGFESREPLAFDEGTQDLLSILVNQATVAVRNAQLYRQVPLAGFWKPLLDKRRKLGALGFESREPLAFDEGTQDLLSILVNQATVAVRNAQLYRQVPLAGFWKPLLDKRRKLGALPQGRRRAWTIGIAAVVLALCLLPWPLRIAAPARVLPGRRASVSSLVDGVVASVVHREGDTVRAGDVIASLKDESYAADLAAARSALSIAESEVAGAREAGDPGAMFDAMARRDQARARVALEEERLAQTRLKSPSDGVIITPRIEERVGQLLPRGAELCVVADIKTLTAEVAVPESEAGLVKAGQAATLKFNPFPGRAFQGTVERVAARIREEGPERFLIAEVAIANPDGLLKTGMLGSAKVRVGTSRMISALFRKPIRYVWNKIWPALP